VEISGVERKNPKNKNHREAGGFLIIGY